jgi:hypothetical protein
MWFDMLIGRTDRQKRSISQLLKKEAERAADCEERLAYR